MIICWSSFFCSFQPNGSYARNHNSDKFSQKGKNKHCLEIYLNDPVEEELKYNSCNSEQYTVQEGLVFVPLGDPEANGQKREETDREQDNEARFLHEGSR